MTDLFRYFGTFDEYFRQLVGPGLVLWHPRGALLTGIVTDYWKEEHRRAGYEMLATPHVGKLALWDTSVRRTQALACSGTSASEDMS